MKKAGSLFAKTGVVLLAAALMITLAEGIENYMTDGDVVTGS